MITNVIFTVPDKTGILGKVAILLLNNGFQMLEQSMAPSDVEGQSLIKIKLEADKAINEDDFSILKQLVPEIIHIDCGNKPASSTISTSDSNDLIALTKVYFDRLVDAYPQIAPIIKTINSELDVATRNEVLSTLGRALGRRQYKTNYALGGVLNIDKTLQRMLKPCLKEFVEVEQFDLSGSGSAEIKLLNCPVCLNHISSSPDCVFISEFINGFLKSVPNIQDTSVKQMQCKAMGDHSCTFNIESTQIN
ncbi:MAG: hypothetical protein KAI17_01845 [Thiotrichaceae bacterium]|nr:hypothetical protein [Thiotrichaceae bacterium]